LHLIVILLYGEILGSGQSHTGTERQHLDALDVLTIGTKPGCDVNFSLEKNPCHVIHIEKLRVIRIVSLHQEVIFQRD